VGAAIITSYRLALDAGAHAVASWPATRKYTPTTWRPGATRGEGEADYAKGNHFSHPDADGSFNQRFIAGRVLSS
jgi:hypothetical protein